MGPFNLGTAENIQRQLEWQVGKILPTQDSEGMIPSQIEFLGNNLQKKKDLPRQAMTTMALSFAYTLCPSLVLQSNIELSRNYILDNLESERNVDKLYTYLYLALGTQYSGGDSASYVAHIQELLSPEIFLHPIAINLYLRLSFLLPIPLPHVSYLTETQRYNLSLTPRWGRFFDYADTLVWAKRQEPLLAVHEYKYLLTHKTDDGWFKDIRTGIPATASVVGKIFEVFSYYTEDDALTEQMYTKLMSRRVVDQYAKDILGQYAEHLISEPNTLRIDDVHTHILVGLCYRFQRFSSAQL